jgi:transcription initiation factor TFIID subunit 1
MDNDGEVRMNGARGRSEYGTPASALNREDDTMSQFSRNSGADIRGKKLRIKRTVKNKYDEFEQQVVTITDPEVIRLYTKRKKQEQLDAMAIDGIQPTGNAEFDAQQRAKSVSLSSTCLVTYALTILSRLEMELARLKRNVERREGREKAKGLHVNTSVPGTPVVNGKGPGATPRKCANCGEVGHIKTNKKCDKTVSFTTAPVH